MRRREWPEFEDQPWFPRWLRDAMTGYLQAVIEEAEPYSVAAPVLRDVIAARPGTSVLDLASGGGGPWRKLRAAVGAPDVTLTDIAPSSDARSRFANESGVEYWPDPVSALAPPETGHEVWTMFTGLHHFSTDEVRRIMTTAQERGVTFCSFEATSRSAAGVLTTALIPLLVLLMMPRVRPRRFLPLLLTYLPPFLPFLIWWDGLASTLRTFTAEELETMASEVAAPGYRWEVRELRSPGSPIPVLSLVGQPSPLVA